MALFALAGLAGAALGFGANKLISGNQKQQSVEPPKVETPQVSPGENKTGNAKNLGRAALIMTSPQGVLGTEPVGRYKLLGNP